MKKFIIFYEGSKRYESYIIEAESLDEAFAIAKYFCRAHCVSLVGVIDETCYSKIHP